MVQGVNGIILRIIQPLIVIHQRFDRFMLTQIQNRINRRVLLNGFGDCRPSEIVRREFSDIGGFTACFDVTPKFSRSASE